MHACVEKVGQIQVVCGGRGGVDEFPVDYTCDSSGFVGEDVSRREVAVADGEGL